MNRRKFLRTGAAGAVSAALLVACGKSGTKVSPTTLAAPTTGPTAAPTTAAGAVSSATTAKAATTKPATAVGAAASGELSIAFDFVASQNAGGPPGGGGGRGPGGVKNPYIAVWVEDAAGAAVRTITLSHENRGRGDRYLGELRRFIRAADTKVASGGADVITTVSTPTKVPGAWKLVWDGKADDGTPVAAGPYVLHIEGAREHGGYEVVSEPFAYGGAAFAKDVAGNGELQNVKLAFKPK